MATGRKRTLPITKVTIHKKKKSPGQSSAVAALQTDDRINLPSSSSEGNFLKLSSYACVHLDTNHAIYLYYQDIPKDQSEGEEKDPPSTPPSFIIHHSGIILLTQQAFRFSHKPEFGIIPL